MKRESEKKAGKACVAYILAFDRKYVPPTVLVFGSCRAREREREGGGEERERTIDKEREYVRACVNVCVISTDKNITQANPRRSFDDGTRATVNLVARYTFRLVE